MRILLIILLVCVVLGCEALGIGKKKCYECQTEIRTSTSSTTRTKEFCDAAEKDKYFKDNNISLAGSSLTTHCKEKN